jgi:hypothetical protein
MLLMGCPLEDVPVSCVCVVFLAEPDQPDEPNQSGTPRATFPLHREWRGLWT